MNQTNYSAITIDASNISNLTDDESRFNDSNIEEMIANSNKIVTLTHQALTLLSEKKFADAAETFQGIIELLPQSEESPFQVNYQTSLMYCNLALCYFYQDDLAAVQQALQDASTTLDFTRNFKNEQCRRLYLKILCNFIILFVKTKDPENIESVLDLVKKFLSEEKNARRRAQYIIQIIYLLYRTDSLIQYNGWQFESDEASLSSESQGVLMIVRAMNYQYTNQPDKASDLFFDALSLWERLGDFPMRLIILRHLLNMYQNKKDTLQKLIDYYNSLLEESGLAESNLNVVFESFDDKIAIIKDLSRFFMELENSNMVNIDRIRYEMDPSTIKLWARLALRNSIIMIARTKNEARIKKMPQTFNSDFGSQNNQQKRTGTFTQDSRVYQSGFQRPNSIDQRRDPNTPLNRSVERYRNIIMSPMYNDVLKNLSQTLSMVEKEESFSVLESLGEHHFLQNFRKQADMVFTRLNKRMAKFFTGYALQMIQMRALSQTPARINKPDQRMIYGSNVSGRNPDIPLLPARPITPLRSQTFVKQDSNLILKARQFVSNGGYLLKLNLTSNGQMNKFMKVLNYDTIRWGKKEAYLRNAKTCHSYQLSEVWGVVYGKCTNTFKRSINCGLEPWLCFSIIFKKRSVDFYCSEDSINYWYIGLAELVKQNRSEHSFVLTPGKFFWRKLKMVMIAVATMDIPEATLKKAKRSLSFSKAVVLCGIKLKEKGKL